MYKLARGKYVTSNLIKWAKKSEKSSKEIV